MADSYQERGKQEWIRGYEAYKGEYNLKRVFIIKALAIWQRFKCSY